MKILAFAGEGIGNCCCFTPAIGAIQQLFPYVRIDIISKHSDVFFGMPFVRPIQGQRDAEKTYNILFTNIFPYPQYYSKIVIEDPWPSPQLNYHRTHEIEQNLAPIYEKGFSGPPPLQYVPAAEMPHLFPKGKPVVGVCDGSKPRSDCQTDEEFRIWSKKRWPHHAEFVRMLLDEGAGVAIFGLESDGPDLDEGTLRHLNLHDLRGKLRLFELPTAMKQCSLIVTNDCGPMHLADAVGARTYAIFGPTSVTKNQPVCINSQTINAREMFNSDEPEQGTPEFARVAESLSLQQLRPEMVRGIIGDLEERQI